jgi:4-carboxymuconolactone decarboxylase
MTMLDPKQRTARGLAIQAEVTGQAAPEATTPLQESWRDFVFAEVWSRPGLDRRARYLIAIAGAALSGDQVMLDAYVQGSLQDKQLSLLELREAALHMCLYGGWSRGGLIDASATRAQTALGLPPVACPPIRAGEWNPEVRTAEGMAEFTKVMTFPGGPSASPFLEAINNFVFGEMWCRRGLDERARRFLTLVGVSESSTEIPIKSHVHSAMSSGNCTPEEMQEFVLQYGIHAGWPKASVIQGVVSEMSEKFAKGLPWNG